MSDVAPDAQLARRQRAATLATVAVILLISTCLVGGSLAAIGVTLVDRGSDVYLRYVNTINGVPDAEREEVGQLMNTGGKLLAVGGILFISGSVAAMVLSIIGLRQNAGSRAILIVALVYSMIGIAPPLLWLLLLIVLPLLTRM